MLRRSTIALVVVAAALAGGWLLAAPRIQAASQAKEPAASPVPPIVGDKGTVRFFPDAPQLSAIRVNPAPEMPVPIAEPLNARIAYNENVTARVSSPVAGRVVSITSQAGDTVKAGAVLVTIDSPDLAAAVSDVQKARADEARKKAAYDRSRDLLEGGVAARKDVESAAADYEQAQSESRRAALRLRNIAPGGAEDGRFALRSPVTGVVADRRVNPGMEVRPDLPDPLFVVSDTSRLWVLVDLPERQLGKVQPGKPVSVQVDAYPDERFQARIEKIGEFLDPATRRIQVRCVVENRAHRLKPEMYARVTLLSDAERTAVRIPNTAIVTQGLYSYAFVQKEPGLFERRRITLSVQDRDYSYVAEGLASGERVVTSGALLLNSQLALGQ